MNLSTNEAVKLDIEKLAVLFPNYKEKIAGIVIKASELDPKIEKLLKIKLVDSKGKVLKFLLSCMIRHRNLTWGMMNSFCYSEGLLDGFIYLKHNFEYIAVISSISNEIKTDSSKKCLDWEKIEIENLYNVKSIVEYLKSSGKKEEVDEFKMIGKQKNIIEYIKKMSDIFQQHYSIVNALSHPNHYTTLGEEFPFITVAPMQYLVDQVNYLQGLLKEALEDLLSVYNSTNG